MALSCVARGRVSRLRRVRAMANLLVRHALRQRHSRRSALAITASGTQLSLAVVAGLMAWYLIYVIGVACGSGGTNNGGH
jgi:hypothetical protein